MRSEDPISNIRPGVSPRHEFFLIAQELSSFPGHASPEIKARRSVPRELRSISISIQPLNDDFRPEGGQFWVVSRDISVKGIGVISHDPVEYEYVKIGLLNEAVTIIGRVRHNTSIGHRYPLYLVGIEFLNEMEI